MTDANEVYPATPDWAALADIQRATIDSLRAKVRELEQALREVLGTDVIGYAKGVAEVALLHVADKAVKNG
jgi:hypothetical protein